MKSAKAWVGTAVLCLAVGMSGVQAQSDQGDEKRGFRPKRLIGKLIPGGKDKEEGSATLVPPGSDGAVVIPSPENPPNLVPTSPPVPMVPANSTQERIPPPPVPAGTPSMTVAPPATVSPTPTVPATVIPASDPFGEAGRGEKERGLLGGVAGMVGKVIPGGREDGEGRSTVETPPSASMAQEERGFLGRLRDRREKPGGDPNIIPPPTIIPRPTSDPAVLPPPEVSSRDTVAEAPRERMSIPLVHSGNPNAPVQREERVAETTGPNGPAAIEPTMPSSPTSADPAMEPERLSAATQAAVGRVALGESSAPTRSDLPAMPRPTGQEVTESISPSVPVSRLTEVPADARAAVTETPSEVSLIPPPALPAAAPMAPTTSPSSGGSLVISDGGGSPVAPVSPVQATIPTPPVSPGGQSAVAALTGEPAAPPAPVAAPPSVVVAPPSAESDAPQATGATHFVSVRDGVAGEVTTRDGQKVAVPSGTVMRFLEGDEKSVRIQLPNGTEAVVETWQVRDATFEEAVEFLKKSG